MRSPSLNNQRLQPPNLEFVPLPSGRCFHSIQSHFLPEVCNFSGSSGTRPIYKNEELFLWLLSLILDYIPEIHDLCTVQDCMTDEHMLFVFVLRHLWSLSLERVNTRRGMFDSGINHLQAI